MRSWSSTSLTRLAISALRWAELRLSLLRFLRWRMTAAAAASRRALVVTQVQTPRVQSLDDLVDRLLAEVGDGVELRLGLGDQISDGLYPGPLEAVVGTHSQLELLDQDVVFLSPRLRQGGPQAGLAGAARAVPVHLSGRTLA